MNFLETITDISHEMNETVIKTLNPNYEIYLSGKRLMLVNNNNNDLLASIILKECPTEGCVYVNIGNPGLAVEPIDTDNWKQVPLYAPILLGLLCFGRR